MITFSVQSEDPEDIKIYASAMDMDRSIDAARHLIRSRLKHGNNVSAEEEHALSGIMDCLWTGE